MQIIGVGLFSSLPDDPSKIYRPQYGYEAIMGFGFGLGLTTLLVLVPMVVNKEDTGSCPRVCFVTCD